MKPVKARGLIDATQSVSRKHSVAPRVPGSVIVHQTHLGRLF